MNRLVLHQIVKNESHCILNMLNSVKGFSDMVVFVDTGSTDGTQDIIRKWGEENNVPAYVFDKQGWKREETWTHWLDADETLDHLSCHFNSMIS